MKRIFFIPLMLVAVLAHAAELEPDMLKAEIKTEGAKKVLNRLWQEEKTFDLLCSKIESGAPEWLEIAQLLRPVSDAAATLSLNYSVARALPKRPERVLGLIGHGFTVKDICTSPFIEPGPGVAEGYEKSTLGALATVKATELIRARDECASLIKLPGSKVSY